MKNESTIKNNFNQSKESPFQVVDSLDVSNHQDFNFLLDQPLLTEEELAQSKFGHIEIAKALTKAIQKCSTPFTIGLFGKWGSGKSTIANLLKKDLEAIKIPVVIFDVWKHQGDALRRTFLRDSVLQLKNKNFKVIDDEFALDERIDKNIKTEIDSPPQLNIPWKNIRLGFLITVLIISILLFVDTYWYKSSYQESLGLAVMTPLFALGSLTILVYTFKAFKYLTEFTDFIFKGFISSKTMTYTIDKFSDPHEFETEFGKLIEALKCKRLVVIFDNLDRVTTHERAIEVLTTIKTFLEPKDLAIAEKEVVFIIPCDDNAIRVHLERVYGTDDQNPTFNPQEFLRKFFNAIFWIPDFIPSELESYTKQMLQLTNVNELDDEKVAWIITKAYRDNPRQVKQFINILLANYLLIRERKEDFSEDFLPNKIPQLAKYLILNELFPDDMNKIRQSKINAIDDLSKYKSENQKYNDFIIDTKVNFPISDIRLFFTLRRSEQEKKFQGFDDFFIGLQDKNKQLVENYLKAIVDFNKKRDEFSRIISERLDNLTNELSLAESISTLLEALDTTGLSLNEMAYGSIYNHLVINKAKKYFHNISPAILYRKIAEPFHQYQNELVNGWINVLSDQKNEKKQYDVDDEYLEEVMKLILKHDSWFAKHGNKIKDILSIQLASKLWIGNIFKDNQTAQKKFLSNQFINNFITSFSNEDIEKKELAIKINILTNYVEELFDQDSYENLLKKIIELQSYENSRTTGSERNEIKIDILNSWQLVLEKFQTKFKEITDQAIWEQLVTSLMDGCNQIEDWDSRRIFIPTMLTIEDFLAEPKISELRNYISDYFKSASKDSMDYVLALTKINILDEKSAYYSILKSRSMQDQNIFDYFYKKLGNEIKTDWLLALLEQDYNKLLTKLESENYKIPDSDAMTMKLLEKVDTVDHSGQSGFFNAINQFKCKNVEQKDNYLDKIKIRLTTADHSLQKIGFNGLNEEKFLGKERNRKLTKEIFDWLKKPEITDKYQPFSIRAINRGYQYLNDEEANNFKQFLFDDIIRLSQNPLEIDFAFSELTKIWPTYRERKQNFEDIRSRYKSPDTNAEMKKALADGLRKLKPNRTSKSDKDFWEWVDTLPD